MPGQLSKKTMTLIMLTIALYLFSLPFIQYPLTTLFKPLPILLLILFILQASLKDQNKTLVLTALGFSLLGDTVLTLPIKTALQAGICLFMLTHIAYISLFLRNAQFSKQHSAFFLPILVFVAVGFYYLSPYLGEMKIPVTVYMCLLCLMVFFSFQVKQHSLLISGGATLFLLSDFSFALKEFVVPDNKPIAILIMFLYYGAQFLLTIGIYFHLLKSSPKESWLPKYFEKDRLKS